MLRIAFLLSLFIGGIIYCIVVVIAVKMIFQFFGAVNKLIASQTKRLLFDNMKYVL